MKPVVFVALIWTINATAAVGLTTKSAGDEYCHEKTPHINYERFIFDFKLIGSNETYNKTYSDCAKQIQRFQISLVSTNK